MITKRKNGVIKRSNGLSREKITEEAIYIETRVEKALKGEGDIDMVRNPYFTPRGAGVPFETNIRTDKMDILLESISAVQNDYYENREKRGKEAGEVDLKGEDSPVQNEPSKDN